MAKYEVTYKCGHIETVQLYGPEKDRQHKLDWMRTCVCKDCYRRQQTERAAEKAAEMGLPELSGSEKQVAWAVTIRQKALENLSVLRAEMVLANQTQDLLDAFDSIVAGIKTQAEARWWIDRRDYGAPTLIRDYRRTH